MHKDPLIGYLKVKPYVKLLYIITICLWSYTLSFPFTLRCAKEEAGLPIYKLMKQFLSMAYPPFLKVLVWGLLVFLQFHDQHSAEACFHEERIALLELKAFLKSNIIIYAHHRLLPSWIDDAMSDCCGLGEGHLQLHHRSRHRTFPRQLNKSSLLWNTSSLILWRSRI